MSVQDGIYLLRNAHVHSTLSVQSVPNIAYETVPMFIWLIMALSCPFKEDQALPLPMPLSSRWLLSVLPLASCLKVLSQASQHLTSSEMQATYVCFPCKSICCHSFHSLVECWTTDNWHTEMLKDQSIITLDYWQLTYWNVKRSEYNHTGLLTTDILKC